MLEAGLEPFPGYLLTRLLGTGAFSAVWEARSAQGSMVALKFLKRHGRHADCIQGEMSILKALKDLRNPGVIAFYGSGDFAHYFVLCLERADGNLAELYDTYRTEYGSHMPRDHAFDLLGQVANTLDFLATQRLPGFNLFSGGLQHCDIKPANLLLVGEQIKVADFGLAAATTWRKRDHGFRGTLPYSPPELCHGNPAPTTDQYALAVTWCEMCQGPGILTAPARLEINPGMLPVDLTQLPGDERVVIKRALDADPTRRWADCRTFLAELQAAQPSNSHAVAAPTRA